MAQAPPTSMPFFGARFSLYPMSDRYVPIILGAIDGIRERGLEVETDDISTFIGGDRSAIWSTLEGVFGRAARTGEHVVMSVLVSHGCPGETYCEPDPLTGTARALASHPGRGVGVSAQWSLYPLGRAGHMDVIYRAIGMTKDATVFEAGKHFVSQLRGDLADVLASIRSAFDEACGDGGHVTAHLTISANSPTRREGRS